MSDADIHRSARKHGVTDEAIWHAVRNAVVISDLEPDAEPPRVLAIGPDQSGNLLEVIWIELAGGSVLVIHAMPLRRQFFALLDKRDQ